MSDRSSVLGRCLRSFGPAFTGMGYLFRTQPNFRIHLVFTCAVVVAGWLFHLAAAEWIAVVLSIGLVLAAEAMNTALEQLADAVHPERHPLVGRAKDCAAAAVLICALASAAVGTMIFAPRLWALVS